MVDISYEQYKTLKKIKKSESVKLSNLTEDELECCEYLLKHKFIDYDDELLGDSIENFQYVVDAYKITQKGHAQLFTFVASFHKWWIPLVISLASLVLSVITLLLKV